MLLKLTHSLSQRAEAIGADGGAFATADQEADAVSVVAGSVAGGQHVRGVLRDGGVWCVTMGGVWCVTMGGVWCVTFVARGDKWEAVGARRRA